MVFNDRFPILFSNPSFPSLIESSTNFMILLNMANRIDPLAKPRSPFRTIRTLPIFKHSVGLLNNGLCHFMVINNICSFGHRNKKIRPKAFSFFLVRFFGYNSSQPSDHSGMINPFLNYIQYLYNHTFVAIMLT